MGEEPEPFVLEVDLAGEAWTLRDVTAEMLTAGREATEREERARAARRSAAAEALAAEVERRATAGEPMMNQTAAEQFLVSARKATRDEARQIIRDEDGRRWRIEPKGKAHLLRPVTQNGAAHTTASDETPRQTGIFEEGVCAARVPPGRANPGTRPW